MATLDKHTTTTSATSTKMTSSPDTSRPPSATSSPETTSSPGMTSTNGTTSPSPYTTPSSQSTTSPLHSTDESSHCAASNNSQLEELHQSLIQNPTPSLRPDDVTNAANGNNGSLPTPSTNNNIANSYNDTVEAFQQWSYPNTQTTDQYDQLSSAAAYAPSLDDSCMHAQPGGFLACLQAPDMPSYDQQYNQQHHQQHSQQYGHQYSGMNTFNNYGQGCFEYYRNDYAHGGNFTAGINQFSHNSMQNGFDNPGMHYANPDPQQMPLVDFNSPDVVSNSAAYASPITHQNAIGVPDTPSWGTSESARSPDTAAAYHDYHALTSLQNPLPLTNQNHSVAPIASASSKQPRYEAAATGKLVKETNSEPVTDTTPAEQDAERKGPKRKRIRNNYNQKQTDMLFEVFKKNRYPSFEEKEEIAALLGGRFTEKEVGVWFKNHRRLANQQSKNK